MWIVSWSKQHGGSAITSDLNGWEKFAPGQDHDFVRFLAREQHKGENLICFGMVYSWGELLEKSTGWKPAIAELCLKSYDPHFALCCTIYYPYFENVEDIQLHLWWEKNRLKSVSGDFSRYVKFLNVRDSVDQYKKRGKEEAFPSPWSVLDQTSWIYLSNPKKKFTLKFETGG